MEILQFLLFGALGGLARGLIGAYKNSLNIGEGKKIEWGKMGLQIGCSLVIGAVVGFVVDQNPVTALASGYAGLDLIESVVKLSKK